MITYDIDMEKIIKFEKKLTEDIKNNEQSLEELKIYYEKNILPKYVNDKEDFEYIKRAYKSLLLNKL